MCAVERCGRKVYSRKADPRGLCQGHHKDLRRFGKVEGGFEARFDLLVDKADVHGCWMWVGGKKSEGGYGQFHNKLAHRLAYEFARGPIAPGMEIDHTCHVLACVNPRHLRVATRKQNGENRRGADSDSATGARGVTRMGSRYKAAVGHLGRPIHVGLFDTIEEAAEAARLKRLELFTHNGIDRMVS